MYRIILYVVLVLGVVGAIGYKFYELNTQINSLEVKLDKLTKDYNSKVVDVGLAKANNKRLEVAIKKQNSYIDGLKVNYDNVLTKWNNLRNKPPKVIYKTLYNTVYKDINSTSIINGDCAEGLKLNKQISNLKYKDL